MKLFDVVRLLRDRPEDGLRTSMEGTIVEVYTVHSEGYEVEFVDGEGRTVGLTSFGPEELELVLEFRDEKQ